MLDRLGRFCQLHHRRVLLVWLLLVVAGFGVSGQVFQRLVPSTGGSASESIQGLRLLSEVSPYDGRVEVVLDGIGPDDPALAPLVADVDRLAGVGRVRWPGSPDGADLVARDGDAVAVIVDLDRDAADPDLAVTEVASVLRLAQRDGLARVLVGGDLVLQEEFNEQVEADLQRAELIALPISLLVLVLVFGGLVAAGLPVIGAVAAVAVTFPTLLAFSTFLELDPNVVPVTTFLGLGLAIDYSLLVVSRFREERGRGLSNSEAIARTTATAGRTILFSGLTVATSLAGLFLFSEPIFRAIAAAGVSVVVIAMAAALTLLPALLAALGDRIKVPTEPIGSHGRFARLAAWVQRRPWPVALLTAGVLVALGVPAFGVQFANGGSELLPAQFESRQVDEVLAARFPGGGAAPITVVSRAPQAEFGSWATQAVAQLPAADVLAVDPPQRVGQDVLAFGIVPAGSGQDDVATALVEQLRALDPPGETYVTGSAAILGDFTASIADRAPWAFALVALATLVLLFLMTGSVVMPVKALVMNVVSLGATFGAIVWVFADGHLEGLLGFESSGAIETWVPVLIFAFAFGLSMDYEVFLLARIKEEYDGLPEYHAHAEPPIAGVTRNDAAVRTGLQRSGGIITSAALLVVIVFAGLATAQMLSIKELGVALAVAVAVDATVVRCLLVPATMTLLGDRNWWAPPFLRRLHDRLGLREAVRPEAEPVLARPS
ncbi:MAG: MMPL family transporter [Geodermatophilaceae bacterium]|nr:MMPL family transporter [Geodermatophilaceae bacterium]